MDKDKKPLVSIVILTKDGGETLKESVKMIFKQETRFTYELIAVDSGSTDGTVEFLKSSQARVIEIEPREFRFGPTRDLGFSKANGECVVTISQDVVPADRGWLEKIAAPILCKEADVVQGVEEYPRDKDVFYWIRTGSFCFTSERDEFRKKYGEIGFSCTNIAIRRSVWDKTRFGDAPMSEDQGLQKKIYSSGYRIIKEKKALVYHGHMYDLKGLMKRCENEGFGWKYLGEKYSVKKIVKDLTTKRWIYGELIRGIAQGKIRNMAELLFVFIRPLAIYKGNRFNDRYKY
ncbi:MAG: glycosyltransferase family 2 protein [Candidatus Omnitrophica bacterium]|nr:glycosyltransferase family 2 protein [Candidatus Omnitrophota bacterium]